MEVSTMIGIGLLLVGCGVFMLVYGTILFRFALAVAGFVLGFAVAWWLTESQGTAVQILVGMVAGGILAATVFLVVRIGLYIAGGLLGAVTALVILSLFRIENVWVNLALMVAGAGLIAFFGRRLGLWLTVAATTLTGAYAAVYGLTQMFPDATGGFDADTTARIPFTGPAFAVFVVLLAVGVLAQLQIARVRDRFVNRVGPG
jgi:hypothetical protein